MLSTIPVTRSTTQPGSVNIRSAVRILRFAAARACAPPNATRRLRQNGAMRRFPSSTTTARTCKIFINQSIRFASFLERLMLTTTARFQRLFTLSQFDAADFATDSLGQCRDELDLAWIFVGCGDALDVLLEFLHQLRRGPIARRQDNERLDNSAAYFVGAGDDGRFGHGVVLEEGALDLEGADAIPGANDHIVSPTYKPEIALGVAQTAVPGNVPFAAEGVGGFLRVLPVFLEQAYRTLRLDAYSNISLLAWRQCGTGVGIDNGHIKTRDRLPHRARLHLHTGIISHQNRRFCLAIAIVDGQTGAGPPGRDHLRVEGLAGTHTVTQLRQIVTLQVFQHHHAIGRGRGTESRNAMLFEEPQSFLGLKTAGAVLDKYCGAHTPGTKEVAVRCLGPAGIREVPMQVPRLQIEPVLARDEVRQWI